MVISKEKRSEKTFERRSRNNQPWRNHSLRKTTIMMMSVITKLLYLLNQGESSTKVEATEKMFFSVTKLFQPKDTGLRRVVYLIIKELSPSADEVRSPYLA